MGLRGSLRGLAWLAGLVTYLALLGVAIKLTASPAPAVGLLRFLLYGVAAFTLWWLTPFLLLCGRVRLRALVVTGGLTAAVLLAASVVSTVFLPRIVGSNERQYGTIGAVFAIQSWLVVMAGLIVGSAVLGGLAAEATGRVGRWTRGSADPLGWRREPHARSFGAFPRSRSARNRG
jgi:membrane protein